MELLLSDQVFALFGYVGTPTVTRVLPILKKFQEENVYMFFPFTGAQPQREPPYGEFAFNLRASYREETAGLVENFLAIGRRRIAVFYQADAYGRSGWAGVREALGAHGEQIVGEATYTRGAQYSGSMRQQVEILGRAEPDAVICIGAYGACAAFLRDAIDLGLEVPIANLSFVGSENLLQLIVDSVEDSERYSRWLVNSQVVPSYEDESILVVGELRESGRIRKRQDAGRNPRPSRRFPDPRRAGGGRLHHTGFRSGHRRTRLIFRAAPARHAEALLHRRGPGSICPT